MVTLGELFWRVYNCRPIVLFLLQRATSGEPTVKRNRNVIVVIQLPPSVDWWVNLLSVPLVSVFLVTRFQGCTSVQLMDDMLSNNENVSDWNGDRSNSQYVSFVRINCNTGAQYLIHYGDVIMGAIASQIISLTIVFSTVLFRRRSRKTSKLRVTGLCAGNSPGTGEFPAQMASIAENVSIGWLHHVTNHNRDAQWGLCDRRSPTVALILIWKKKS